MIIDKAKAFESYILDDAKLPESYEDKTMDMYKSFMNGLLPNKSIEWIPVDSGITPAYDTPIVVKVEESDDCYIGQYTMERGWDVANAPYKRSIIAWLPIPEYKSQTI